MTTCPNCSVELQQIYDRRFLEVPSFQTQDITKVLVRFPLMQCPVCKERYESEATQPTINQAVQEFVEKDFSYYMDESYNRMDKALKRYRISFMMLGICVGIYLGGGVNLMLKGESLWGGVQAGTAVILFILFAFASDIKSLIKSTYSRIKSKISKK